VAYYKELSVSLVDHSNEKAVTAVRTAGVTVDEDALVVAIDSLTLDNISTIKQSTITTYAGTAPSSESANNELKLLIGYQDTTTNDHYTVTIPAPDFTQLIIPANTDYVDLVTASYFVTSFVPAFELAVRSKAGNAVLIRYAKVVGRNV